MRILHIDTGAEMRGGQHQVLLLLKGLRDAGHESILLARHGGALARAAEPERVPVHSANLRNVWQRSSYADVVHAHDAHGHTLAALASRKRFVVSRRVAFAVRRSFPSAWKYRRAERFLAVSDFVACQLQKAGIPREKIDLVYDGVAVDERAAPWSPEYPAVALALRDLEKGRDLVEKAAQLSGVRVTFSENLKQDLQRASMFVYITRTEGLGSAALLAMAMGVPVIASRVEGLAEVFEDGLSGLYVENSPESIASGMRRLLDDTALAHRITEEGMRRVAERFTREHLVRRTVASYERALDR